MRSIMPDKHPLLRRLARGLLTAAFWLGVWWLAAIVVHQELLVPTPPLVVATLFRLAQTKTFWMAAGFSLIRIVAGFAAGVVIGCLAGALTVRVAFFHTLFSPALKIVRATPVASFIILAFVWIRTDILPAFIAFLMVLPVVWGNVDKGLREVDGRLLEMAQVFHLRRTQTLLQIRIPSVMPYFLSACTTSLGLAWKSGIAAEVICRPEYSIGRLLQTAKNHLETPEVFAHTAVVILLSVVLERLLLLLARRLGRRYNAV